MVAAALPYPIARRGAGTFEVCERFRAAAWVMFCTTENPDHCRFLKAMAGAWEASTGQLRYWAVLHERILGYRPRSSVARTRRDATDK